MNLLFKWRWACPGMFQIGIAVELETKQTFVQTFIPSQLQQNYLKTQLWPADATESRWPESHPYLKCFASHTCASDVVMPVWLCYRDPVFLRSPSQPFLAAWDNSLILRPGKCLKCFASNWLRSYQTLFNISFHSLQMWRDDLAS